eukprot:Gb_25758 [translate_table: standard]
MEIGAIFPDLTYLAFSSNNLSSIVPSSIGNMKYLKILCLSDNKLYGKIPSTLGNCSALQASKLEKNSLIGGFQWSTSLMQLIILNPGMNKILGHIPRWLANLLQLRVVVLRSNSFEGKEPTSLQMPGSLGFLNLSYSRLSGRIPDVRHLDKFGADSYVGNPNLYGRPLNKSCWPAVAPPKSTEDDDEDEDGTENELEWRCNLSRAMDRTELLLLRRLGIWLPLSLSSPILTSTILRLPWALYLLLEPDVHSMTSQPTPVPLCYSTFPPLYSYLLFLSSSLPVQQTVEYLPL